MSMLDAVAWSPQVSASCSDQCLAAASPSGCVWKAPSPAGGLRLDLSIRLKLIWEMRWHSPCPGPSRLLCVDFGGSVLRGCGPTSKPLYADTAVTLPRHGDEPRGSQVKGFKTFREGTRSEGVSKNHGLMPLPWRHGPCTWRPVQTAGIHSLTSREGGDSRRWAV